MVFTNPTYSSPPQQDQNDDISVLFRQIIHHRSSPLPSSQPFMSASSSVTTMRAHAPNHRFNHHFHYTSTPLQLPQQDHHELNSGPCHSAIFSGSDRLVVDRISHDARDGVVLPPSTEFNPPIGSNLSSESLSGSFQLRSFDNNHHEFAEDNECDSEEREDLVVEEVETKQQTLRNQSKRTRAAEVHNLSEKRRRSRINEKMKALQNLIPNSNKTDKASMLDEAIEYLKQLQLQVQMLSLRNGLSLHPMCNPGGLHPSQLSQLGLNFDKGGGTYDIDLTNALANTLPETSNTLMNLPNQCTSAIRPSLPVASTIIDSVPMPFGRESCMPTNFGHFQLHNSQAICRERGVTEERSVDDVETRSSVTAILRPGHKSIERMQQKLEPQENLLENASAEAQLISSNFSGLLATSSGAQLTR